MVRKLFILRHGEAESGRNWTDINRPLTDQGKKDVLIVGAKLKSKAIRFDHVLCSTARRTKETASLFLEPFTDQPNLTFHEELYNATLDEVRREIMNIPEDYTSVVLIGHNPSVSSLATYLLNTQFISLSPGQWMAFDLSIEEWKDLYKGCGTLFEI